MQIGNRIKFMRESRGWSQVQLVNEARKYIPEGKVLARETMSRIENGHRPPDLWVLSAIAQALGLTPGEILDGVEAGPPAPSPPTSAGWSSGWNCCPRPCARTSPRR